MVLCHLLGRYFVPAVNLEPGLAFLVIIRFVCPSIVAAGRGTPLVQPAKSTQVHAGDGSRILPVMSRSVVARPIVQMAKRKTVQGLTAMSGVFRWLATQESWCPPVGGTASHRRHALPLDPPSRAWGDGPVSTGRSARSKSAGGARRGSHGRPVGQSGTTFENTLSPPRRAPSSGGFPARRCLRRGEFVVASSVAQTCGPLCTGKAAPA